MGLTPQPPAELLSLSIAHCASGIAHCALGIGHCASGIAPRALRIVHCILCISLFLCSCGNADKGGREVTESESKRDLTEEATAWADSVLSQMTLEQKAAQCVMPAVYALSDAANMRQVGEYGDLGAGGVVLLKGSVEGACKIADSMRRTERVPPFIAIDAEWGLAMRLEGGKRYRKNGDLGSDLKVTETEMFDYGAEVAAESRKAGINMVLGPVLDVSDSEGYIGERAFGADPEIVALYGVSYAKGLESGGVISVAKHFPGHGNAKDSHWALPLVSKSRDELEAIDLYPFKEYIAERLPAIMVGHLAIAAYGEVPSAVNKEVITGLLRNRLHFSGLVLTDALNMNGAAGCTAADALAAGADIVLAPRNVAEAVSGITEAVTTNTLPLSALNDRVRRILFYKYLYLAN